jgi:hypothetical protein
LRLGGSLTTTMTNAQKLSCWFALALSGSLASGGCGRVSEDDASDLTGGTLGEGGVRETGGELQLTGGSGGAPSQSGGAPSSGGQNGTGGASCVEASGYPIDEEKGCFLLEEETITPACFDSCTEDGGCVRRKSDGRSFLVSGTSCFEDLPDVEFCVDLYPDIPRCNDISMGGAGGEGGASP